MKKFTISLLILFSVLILKAQNAEFNWLKLEFSPGHNLKDMSIDGMNTNIVGYGNTFIQSKDGGNTWSGLNLFSPKFILIDISIKNNTGFVAARMTKLYDATPDISANGFLLKTTDGGSTWTKIEDMSFGLSDDPGLNPNNTLCYGLNFQSIEAINDSLVYCGIRWSEYKKEETIYHSGIFKSIDGGLNWKNISGKLEGKFTNAIVSKGEEVHFGGVTHYFKTSIDSDTLINLFDKVKGNGNESINDITIKGNNIYVITTADSIHYSNNGGETFQKFHGIKGGFDIFEINDSTLIVGYSKNKSYISTNYGESWNSLEIADIIWEIAGVVNDSIHLLSSSAIYKGAITDLLAGNYTFEKQSLGAGILQKAYINSDKMMVVGNDNTFYSSENSGISWNNVDLPENKAMNEFYEEVDFEKVSMLGDEGFVNFKRIKFASSDIYPGGSSVYWSGGLVQTKDNWTTAKKLDMAKIGKENSDDPSINPNHEDCNGLNPTLIKYLGDDVLLAYVSWYDYATGNRIDRSRVFKTLDAGKNWTAISEDLGSSWVQDIEIQGDSVLYLAGRELLLRSRQANLKDETGILAFENLYPILDENEDDKMFINNIKLNGNRLFLVTSLDSCYYSNDGGATFSVIGNSKGSNDFYQIDENSWIMLGGTGKSIYTNDSGASWQDCHPGTTIYAIGGEYNGYLYGLAKGAVFITKMNDLHTASKMLALNNNLKVLYNQHSIDLLSKDKPIEKCNVYTITGKLVSSETPFSKRHSLNKNRYKTGIYIVRSEIGGIVFTNKIVFK